MSAPELAPCYDPVSHLVYAAAREHVTHVFVNGELRVRDGVLRGSAFSGLDTRWQLWQNALEQHKPRADSGYEKVFGTGGSTPTNGWWLLVALASAAGGP